MSIQNAKELKGALEDWLGCPDLDMDFSILDTIGVDQYLICAQDRLIFIIEANLNISENLRLCILIAADNYPFTIGFTAKLYKNGRAIKR